MAETAVLEEPQEIKTPQKRKSKPSKPSKAQAPADPQPAEPKQDRVPKTITFMQRVARIAKPDWGTRARLKLYRLEPLIDRTRTGDPKMVDSYGEPIDEERIMLDHGSGRYRLYLTYKMPAVDEGKELDSIELEILNTAYPPKLLLGQWIDDPKNKKWAWAKTALEKAEKLAAGPVEPPRSGTSDVLETMQVLTEIRKGVAEEFKPRDSGDPVDRFIKGVEMGKAMAPAPVAATDNAILNTVVTLFQTQLASQAEEMRELRKELRESKSQPAANGNGLSTVTQTIEALGGLLPKVKELFPNLTESVGRSSRMPAWMEFVQPAIGSIGEAFKPLVAVLANKIMMGGQQIGQQQPQPLGGGRPPQPTQAQQIPGAQQPPQEVSKMIEFLNAISPAMFRHLDELQKGQDPEVWGGSGFASSVDDLYGEHYEGFDWLTEAKKAGPENIAQAYQNSRLWPRLQPQEQRFRQFVSDFVSWTRPTQEGDEEEPDVDLSNPAMVN